MPVLLSLLALVIGLLLLAPGIVDSQANKTYDGGLPPDPSAAERARHRSLFIVDLHADTLLWDRAILARSGRGHVDLPRLVEANVALQVFAVVSKVPFRTRRTHADGSEDSCHDASGFDTTAALRIAQAKPPGLWFDGEAAAMAQAAALQRHAEASREARRLDPRAPELMLILDADDLARLIERRGNGEPVVGGMLALEGTHWIDGDDNAIAAAVARLVTAGFRMAGPIHRFDNALGRSSEGCGTTAAATQAGESFLRAAEAHGLIVDLAHASDDTILAALAARKHPVAVSHTGIRRLCQAKSGCRIARNLGDETVRAIARNGGVIGIGYWTGAVGRGTSRIVDAFEAALDTLEDPVFVAEMRTGGRIYDPRAHLALGSDFDGASLVPFDVTGLDGLTAALARRTTRFDDRSLRLIAGINACRMLAMRLPGGGASAAKRICDSIGVAPQGQSL